MQKLLKIMKSGMNQVQVTPFEPKQNIEVWLVWGGSASPDPPKSRLPARSLQGPRVWLVG